MQLRLLADALERDQFEGQQLYHVYREEFLKIKNTQSDALKAARDAAAAAAASKQEEEAKSAWTQAEVALFIQAFNKVWRVGVCGMCTVWFPAHRCVSLMNAYRS